MDYRADFPQKEDIHYFLQTLDDSPSNTKTEQITKLAENCLGIGFPRFLFFHPDDGIIDAVKILKKEITEKKILESRDFSQAQKEISGAINGLNILLKHETDVKKQKAIQEKIRLADQYGKEINLIISIKEAVANHPKLSNIIQNTQFMKDFESLMSIYGKNRKIDPTTTLSFIKLWRYPDLRMQMNEFINAVRAAREANLDILQRGEIPSLEEKHNELAIANEGKLNEMVANYLESEMGSMLSLTSELIGNRAMVNNTQSITDGYFLAFNSKADDAESTRRINTITKGVNEYEKKMRDLQNKKADGEIKRLERLINYQRSPIGFFYEKTHWEPIIGPNDPIAPLKRTLGFAIVEGKKRETTTELDFTKTLGAENLNLTVDERKKLSELLLACDSEVSHHVRTKDGIKQWEKPENFPEKIKKVIDTFNNNQFPHLKNLSDEKKNELVNEALRFSFEVNYNFYNDLLNLF